MSRRDEARAAMEARHRRWLSGRDAELARRDVEEEQPRPRSTAQTAPSASALDPSAVLDRITARLAERMRDELHVALQQEGGQALSSQQDLALKMEHKLSSEVASHTCPICYELMAGKEHAPVLLFPCGHTFCAQCVGKLQGAPKDVCPVCRARVTSKAPNVSLRNIINALVHTRDAVRQRAVPLDGPVPHVAASMLAGAGPDVDPAGGLDASRYASQFEMYAMRASVLSHELRDTKAELGDASESTTTALSVLDRLHLEREAAEERVSQAQASLDVLRSQERDQERKLASCQEREKECRSRIHMLEATLAPLRVEMEKCRLIAQDLNPSVQLSGGPKPA